MMVLAGCASDDKSDSDSAASETNKGTEQVAVDENGNPVDTDTIEAQNLTPEEQLAQNYGDAILETTIRFEFDQSAIPAEFTATLDAHTQNTLLITRIKN